MLETIYVSGCPLLLDGFNGEYIRAGNNEVWRRHTHTLLGIPIRPMAIASYKGKWILVADDGFGTVFYESNPSPTPIGTWEGGIKVSEQPEKWPKLSYLLASGLLGL